MHPHFHHPRKRFGQHFLSDQAVLLQMERSIAPRPQDHMVEIGPGLGVLTRYLIDKVAKYEAIEIDRDLAPILQEAFAQHANFVLHTQDVLKTDWAALHQHQKLRLVGNLPYNISTPLLFSLFEVNPFIQDMHFLLQKEVGERLCAEVGSTHYGRLSVMSQYYGESELLFFVEPFCFTPPPKVDSVFLRLTPVVRTKIAKDLVLFEKIVGTAFNQRRKTLRNSLRALVDPAVFEELGIDAQKRAQELTVDEYITITNYWVDNPGAPIV